MRLIFTEKGWHDHLYWQQTNKTILKNVNGLIKEILRTPFEGSGRPEALKGNFSGYWSRRITMKDRLVYTVEQDAVVVFRCKDHYKIS